jgi:hypothetical protein
MSVMQTQPVFLCRRCKRPLVVAHLSTASPDPDGRLLHDMMSNLHKIALCDHCQKQRTWYAQNDRIEDWEAGRP